MNKTTNCGLDVVLKGERVASKVLNFLMFMGRQVAVKSCVET